MGLAFLTPMFFGGLALLGLPYLIHRIRRPEREPMRFSSLLFIPDVHKEVIERRRIQHLLLMLLRMLVLALLALAFARPYWRAMAAADPNEAPKRHLVLLDASYSMGRGGAFDEAKRAARRVIDTIDSGEPIGVIVFADRPSVTAPLQAADDSRAGSKDAARDAVNFATLSDGATDYVSALELAQQQFLAGVDDDAPLRSLVHLVTDSQRAGLPTGRAGWKLAPSIELDVVAVGVEPARDLAVTETHVRPVPDGALRVLGKVRNWSDTDAKDIEVRINIAGADKATKTLDVKAGSATQVSFEFDDVDAAEFDGYLEVTSAGAPADDRRYFSYSAPRQGRVAIVSASAQAEERSGAWFLGQALPENVKSPWRAIATAADALSESIAGSSILPDAVMVTESSGLSAAAANALIDYVESGGQLIVAVGDRDELGPLAAALDEAGLKIGSPQYNDSRPGRFEILSWVDFDHPIFAPFQGTRYNDFSQVRFYNHVSLDVREPARVLARLDDDAPAIAEATLGEGRVIAWPFALRLEWTNLPKTQRLVPILFETLAYVSDWEDLAGEYTVGDSLAAAALEYDASGEAEIMVPGADAPQRVTAARAGVITFDHPGILRARAAGAPQWTEARAVNVDPREGDPERLEPETLLARVATSSVIDENTVGAGIVGADVDAKGYTIDEEYGRWALIAVCVLVLIECLYMTRLSLSRRSAPPTNAAQAQ